jgi:hypothetical protein
MTLLENSKAYRFGANREHDPLLAMGTRAFWLRSYGKGNDVFCDSHILYLLVLSPDRF